MVAMVVLAALIVTVYISLVLYADGPRAVRTWGSSSSSSSAGSAAARASPLLHELLADGDQRSVASFLRDWRYNNSVYYHSKYRLSDLLRRRTDTPQALDTLDRLFASTHVGAPDVEPEPLLKTYAYDPRLTMAVYLDHLRVTMAPGGSDRGSEAAAVELPFSWYDWADLSDLNDFIDLPSAAKPGCSFVVNKYFPLDELLAYEARFRRQLFTQDRGKALAMKQYSLSSDMLDSDAVDPRMDTARFCADDASALQPGFKVHATLNWSRPEVFALQARSALYSTAARQPLSITFLNDDTQTAIQLPVQQNASADAWRPSSLLFNGLLEQYLARHVKGYPAWPRDDVEFDHLHHWKRLLLLFRGGGKDASARRQPYRLELAEADFEFDGFARSRELRALRETAQLSRHQAHYLFALERSLHTHSADMPKYFEEASAVTDFVHLGHHYDARFFRGILPADEIRARLDAVVRAWLHFTAANDLTAWLAHGTLYGWLYNGLAFTWDGDHDVQMPIAHLQRMAERFNQTLVVEDPTYGNGRYFLDVSSFITSRTKGNGLHNIDARFIDVDSGLYVDITGLSVSAEPAHPRFDWLINKYFHDLDLQKKNMPFYEDPNYVPGLSNLTAAQFIDQQIQANASGLAPLTHGRLAFWRAHASNPDLRAAVYRSKSARDRYNINKHAQLYNCRNRHFQALFELSPLRLTYFHGAPAYVPNLVIKDLNAEYKVPADNSYQNFEGKTYLPEMRAWFPSNVVKDLVRTLANSKDAPPGFNEDSLRKLSAEQFAALLETLSRTAKLEPHFDYVVNTAQISAFRLRELELTYDPALLRADKDLLLHEFVRDRRFAPVYKDVFQHKLEAALWADYLAATNVSYAVIDRTATAVRADVARDLLDLDRDLAGNSYKWRSRAGVQIPASPLNFHEHGNRFFITGQKWHNDLFKTDPVDLDTAIADMYHLADERKYSSAAGSK